ncbi:isoflavone reductase [Echria macrotheca]|uniref:Isoflavone reductase n=1 Tax=Echria macrotheca TaxID=438768 RepID=A0AAJ0BKP4_9PEZI|nr:isoflavone reductase [Echria macrotheca]
MAIKTVAVVGATGNVGLPTVHALLAASFSVVAITRPTSNPTTLPPNVPIRRADLTSLASLTEAFKDIDAVVVTIATAEVSNQRVLADAALAAGVKRFIPSEFGHSLARLIETKSSLATILMGKANTASYLRELAEKNEGFSWTGIATSPFFDWGLDHAVFGFDFPKRKVSIVDSGDERVSVSSMRFVGEAVARVLLNEEETKNKEVEVVEFTVSQNEILKIFEEEIGEKWSVAHVRGADLEKSGNEKLAGGNIGGAFLDLLQSWNLSDGGDHAVKEDELANGMLGLKGRSVREVMKEYIKAHV